MSGSVDLRLDTRAGGSLATLIVDNRAKLNTLNRALMLEFIGKVEALGCARGSARAGSDRRRRARLHRGRRYP